MATALAYEPEAYPHIVKTPGVRGGKACVAGTRLAVIDIVSAHQQGHSPEEIQTLFSTRPLTLAEVYAALAHYYDHAEEIEAEIATEERRFDEAERQWQDLLARNGGQPPEHPTPEERAIPRPFHISSRT
ncbi:MAG: DUF433 domain-containing protein [Vicinamibacteria bacterium]|jgi:uncharacterized protein (DUF433 family)|nr:DUF433 domain-containing protein [Vicinamibacteria bacterium]